MPLDMDSLDTKQYTLSSQMAYVTSTGDGTVVGVIADEEGYSVKLWDTEKGEFSKAGGTISSWIENNIEPAGENAFLPAKMLDTRADVWYYIGALQRQQVA